MIEWLSKSNCTRELETRQSLGAARASTCAIVEALWAIWSWLCVVECRKDVFHAVCCSKKDEAAGEIAVVFVVINAEGSESSLF